MVSSASATALVPTAGFTAPSWLWPLGRSCKMHQNAGSTFHHGDVILLTMPEAFLWWRFCLQRVTILIYSIPFCSQKANSWIVDNRAMDILDMHECWVLPFKSLKKYVLYLRHAKPWVSSCCSLCITPQQTSDHVGQGCLMKASQQTSIAGALLRRKNGAKRQNWCEFQRPFHSDIEIIWIHISIRWVCLCVYIYISIHIFVYTKYYKIYTQFAGYLSMLSNLRCWRPPASQGAERAVVDSWGKKQFQGILWLCSKTNGREGKG